MEIFKQLSKLGYRHYIDLTIEELDMLPIDNIEKRVEYSLVIDWFLKKKHLYIDITFKEVKGPKIEGINSVYFDIEIYSIFGGDAWKKYRFSEISDDYYYAREQAILKAIELCKDKK